MVKLEFGIKHRGCLVNEASRALPDLRILAPGGFLHGAKGAEEILVIDRPGPHDVDRFLNHFRGAPGIATVELLERTPDKAFFRVYVTQNPPDGFCSEAVFRNRGLRVGLEVQVGGVEQWTVACFRREDAENLVRDLQGMGDLTYHRIGEASWGELLSPARA
ncbi:MAG: hypothetical protein FJ029_04120 [Actinobacteria bacterium]|nr:hypothetical protein [Actinomycetota bacterium]